MSLTKDEMETVIRCSAADAEWSIVTADPRMIRYLTKRGFQPKVDYQFSSPYLGFAVPFKKLRFLTAAPRKSAGKPFPVRQIRRQSETTAPEP